MEQTFSFTAEVKKTLAMPVCGEGGGVLVGVEADVQISPGSS